MAFTHWEYFLTLDDDLGQVARYIEFADDNFATYSVELVRIILAAASEIDVVAKSFCRTLNSSDKFENIDHYRKELIARYPKFPTLKITVPRFSLSFQPWAAWGKGQNPSWWNSHTDVKHHRDSHYNQANLENALNTVTGLFAFYSTTTSPTCISIGYARGQNSFTCPKITTNPSALLAYTSFPTSAVPTPSNRKRDRSADFRIRSAPDRPRLLPH